ncbi:hypothetical protein F2Q68_00009376 [Brassica cretica]|uniref:Secreted protein n=1 Tax=Brassica cretica TaxID=69181 RepID=A0A8S9KZA8_BRACR|nr:hypothetical protein F2Q68_00009376 [Brassica cretica]
MSRKLHQTAKATTLCLALPFVHFPATGDVWPLTVVYVSASRRKHGQLVDKLELVTYVVSPLIAQLNHQAGSPLRGSFPRPGQAAGQLHPGGLSPKAQYPLL